MSAQQAPGWFGKVSMLGDFASRRLPADWVQACDQWLSGCMHVAQGRLGPRWLDAYLAAPVWRFAWAPGVVDPHWWFGVLMPSCDNAGRYFPLLVVHPRAQAPVDRIGLDHLDAWWGQVAAAATRTLGEGARLEDFESALHHLPPWPGSPAGPALNRTAHPGRDRFAVPAGASASQVAPAWAASSLLQQLEGQTLWSPWSDPTQAGSLTVHRGLPMAEQFVDLLLGRW